MATARTRPLRVVVNAGPTREHLDDVRYLSNASTGLMGQELAREAKRRGAQVTLVLGPSELTPLPGVTTIDVVSTRDLLRAMRTAVKGADLVIFAAAPADWRPAVRHRGKLKKDGTGRAIRLTLLENPDVAATLGRTKGRRFHLGFALEIADPFEHARAKMARKRLDAIVLNGPKNVGTGGGAAWLLSPDGDRISLPTGDKKKMAHEILDAVWDRVLARRKRRS